MRNTFKAITACIAALLCAGNTQAATSACTAFGNAPRTVNKLLSQAQNALVTCKNGIKLGGFNDGDGLARNACFYDNGAATPAHPLPLVVYLQASMARIDAQIAKTGLIDARITTNLTDDATSEGFLLLAPLPRFTNHYYPLPNGYSLGFDVWYRQFAREPQTVAGIRYAPNVDFATIDHFIDEQIASGRVDLRRIYLVGYSNGASTAVLYAQNRPEIAAAAIYSAPDPYGFLNDPCQQQPVADATSVISEISVPRTDAPIFHVHNDCDVYGSCPNAVHFQQQIDDSGTAQMTTEMIDKKQNLVNTCDAICGIDPNGSPYNLKSRLTGTANHNRWPDAWNARLLDFLRMHPLPPPPPAPVQ